MNSKITTLKCTKQKKNNLYDATKTTNVITELCYRYIRSGKGRHKYTQATYY